MNSETLTLRKDPIFEITLTDNSFVIKNEADKNDSGIYKYAEIISLKLQEKRTNWIITILSFIFDFIGGPAGQLYKEKNLLIINYNESIKKILLIDCDMSKAKRIAEHINSKHIKN